MLRSAAVNLQIPDSTLAVLRASRFAIVPEPFVYVKAGAVGDGATHLLVARDELETTVVTHERNLAGVEVLDRNPDRWLLLSIDCANPFYCVGFLAAICGAFAGAGIDVLAVSAFTRDLVLVKETERERARELLLGFGMTER